MAQLPEPLRRPDATGRVVVGVCTDAARATHQFAAHLAQVGAEFSLGANLGHVDIHTALAQLPPAGWTPAYQATKPRAGQSGPQIELRDGAWVAELTGLVDLSGWPAGTRLILRNQRPHPARSCASPITMACRSPGLLTNTTPGGPGRQLADLELRHRRHAHARGPHPRAAKIPDCVTCLPRRGAEPDLAGIAALAADLLAWTARFALPTSAASYEPNGCGCGSWQWPGGSCDRPTTPAPHRPPLPWADMITTTHTRFCALPAP